jgi:hypothetical protein
MGFDHLEEASVVISETARAAKGEEESSPSQKGDEESRYLYSCIH